MGSTKVRNDEASTDRTVVTGDEDHVVKGPEMEGSAASSSINDFDVTDLLGDRQHNHELLDDDISSSDSFVLANQQEYTIPLKSNPYGVPTRRELSAVMELSGEGSEAFSLGGSDDVDDSAEAKPSRNLAGRVGRVASMIAKAPIKIARRFKAQGEDVDSLTFMRGSTLGSVRTGTEPAVAISKEGTKGFSSLASVDLCNSPQAVTEGSKQAAGGATKGIVIHKMPQAGAKGLKRATASVVKAPKSIFNGIQQSAFHQSTFLLDDDDDVPPSLLGFPRRGPLRISAGSESMYGSSMSLISTTSRSIASCSSSSLPFVTSNESSSGNSSDTANKTQHSLLSDYRSSLSTMPSLATIVQEDDLPSSAFSYSQQDSDMKSSWNSFASRNSIRTLSPVPSEMTTRVSFGGFRGLMIRDDSLAGRTLDELPQVKILLHEKSPDKQKLRWDCSTTPGADMIQRQPQYADSIPTYFTRYSSTSSLFEADERVDDAVADVAPTVPARRVSESPSASTHVPKVVENRIPHVPPFHEARDAIPRAAQRQSSGSVSLDIMNVPSKASSWSSNPAGSFTDSKKHVAQQRSSITAVPMPTLIEQGVVPNVDPGLGTESMEAGVVEYEDASD
jgi:hypothetical protein